MTLQEFIQRLEKPRKSGAGYIALCPAHDDQQPSLSVTEADGKVLLHCHSGCDFQSVVSALGIELKDLFTTPKRATQTDDFQPKNIVAVYEYKDENSNRLYENVRFDPKDFRQRHFDANGKAVWGLNGIRRVPYRLPELIKAVESAQNAEYGATIWLVEGEKDVDNLRSLGFTVSSFKNWKPEFNSYLKSAHVCLLQDHDKAGLKQANDACKLLSDNVASLKLLDFFADEPLSEKHGKDFSDWFENEKQSGLSAECIAEKLCILADNANVWQPDDTEVTDAESAEAVTSLFIIQDANSWINSAKQRPVPKMLFGELWYEGEFCFLFADTGKGKTILAVQIGNSISKGIAIANFTLQTAKQKVLYLDFELSEKQFEARYSTKGNGDFFTNHYVFDENFKRGEINQESFLPEAFEDFETYLFFSLEKEIVKTGAKVLIVDNITYLKNATETAKDALPLMKALIRLKKKYDLSILALAHTPKRDLSKPLTVNDLQGSKMLSNFADSIFAIGESAKDKHLRYLKQIKARNTEIIYDAENVAVCQVIKPDNFLMFEFLSVGSEREHLKVISENDKTDIIEKAKKLSASNYSQREIAKELCISVGSVNNYLKK